MPLVIHLHQLWNAILSMVKFTQSTLKETAIECRPIIEWIFQQPILKRNQTNALIHRGIFPFTTYTTEPTPTLSILILKATATFQKVV